MSTWRPSGSGGAGDQPRSLAESLNDAARSLGGADASAMNVVFRHWDTVVGPAVAERTEPLSLRSGVLLVGVTEPAWATQLRFLAVDILARLEEAAGHPVADRLEVRVRPLPGR